MLYTSLELSKAQEARTAIERLYIEMRHIFNSGSLKVSGTSGNTIAEALLTLSPEIYGSIKDCDKVELNGLVYVIDRLPKGIEQCRLIKFTSEEGYASSSFEMIIPLKRRRSCYRIDSTQMVIEVTRGRSEIYDMLTHLTFLYNEAKKIKAHAFDEQGNKSRDWKKLEEIVKGEVAIDAQNRDIAFAYLSSLLGRSFEETRQAYHRLAENLGYNNGLFHIVYWLGHIAFEEEKYHYEREVVFTPALRERIGSHIHGEKWANNIKQYLQTHHLFDRPVHIISANLHSVMNSLYAYPALKEVWEAPKTLLEVAIALSKAENTHLVKRVTQYAQQHGMALLPETSNNISVQIFDTAQLKLAELHPEIRYEAKYLEEEKPVLIVTDYAFGEQAYETMDELLKPLYHHGENKQMPVSSISIMGKAGILYGGKGDIMIPTAHVFEGTADNYPFENEFKIQDFEGQGCQVCEGAMITVLGTSLQNKDVLEYFKKSSWQAIGLEMEGAHYQKAIQAEVKIRRNISSGVTLRYAYYASDNPLETGSTLASGSLGLVGVKPTYLITKQILNKIFMPGNNQSMQANHTVHTVNTVSNQTQNEGKKA